MTGVLNLAKSNIFSGLNNFNEHDLKSDFFAVNFGMTEYELDEILDKCVHNNNKS